MFDDRAVLANRSSGDEVLSMIFIIANGLIHLLKKCLVHLNYGLNNGEKRMKKAKIDSYFYRLSALIKMINNY